MSIDIEGRLRPAGIKGNSTVYLGDVARAALRSLGPADPPFFESKPGYDEQRWRFSTSSGDVSMIVLSDSYWGFGLLARCFVNQIEITGPLALRARIVHDIAATLGRNPWEPSWTSRFEKKNQALVEADPTTEVRSSEEAASDSRILTWWDKNEKEEEVEASHLLEDELPVVDLTGEE